jgi:hypothetical protein
MRAGLLAVFVILSERRTAMAEYCEDDYRGRTVRNARGVISQNLDTVESGVDIAIETAKEAVHELRDTAQEVAGKTVGDMQRTWDKKRPRIERYMETHPWVVFGALLFLAYLFSGERTRERIAETKWP